MGPGSWLDSRWFERNRILLFTSFKLGHKEIFFHFPPSCLSVFHSIVLSVFQFMNKKIFSFPLSG